MGQGAFTVTITLGGKQYSWTAPAAVTLEAGKIHTLELTVGHDVVAPGTFNIAPWTEGGTTNVTTD